MLHLSFLSHKARKVSQPLDFQISKYALVVRGCEAEKPDSQIVVWRIQSESTESKAASFFVAFFSYLLLICLWIGFQEHILD